MTPTPDVVGTDLRNHLLRHRNTTYYGENLFIVYVSRIAIGVREQASPLEEVSDRGKVGYRFEFPAH